MTIPTFTLLLLVSLDCLSQDNLSTRRTDSIISCLNREVSQIEHFKYLPGYIEYGILKNDFTKIIHSYKAGPRDIIETFYTKDSFLIFATKKATCFYLYGDSIVILGKYYFNQNSLKYYSIYHGEEENDITKIQESVLNQLDKIKSIILNHQKKKNGG